MLSASGTACSVITKLQAREEARRAADRERAAQAESVADPREDVGAWLAAFGADHASLATAVSQASSSAAGAPAECERADLLASLEASSGRLARLEASAAAAAYFLPPFEQRSVTAQLGELRAQIAAAKAALQPRRKFAFSKAPVTRTPGAGQAAQQQLAAQQQQQQQLAAPQDTRAADQADAAQLPGAPGPPSAHDLQLIASGQGAQGLRGATLVVPAGQLAGRAFVLHDLQDCTVFLLGHMSAMRLQQLVRCGVYAGPVSGASFVSGASGSTFMLASHQVRIHDAIGCDFYLRTRSRPIIEHSSRLRFAPCAAEALLASGDAVLAPQRSGGKQRLQQPAAAQPGAQQASVPAAGQLAGLLAAAQLDVDTGLWQCVDDFGWVKASQSPHWSLLPEADRQSPDAMLPVADEWLSVAEARAS